MKLAFILGIFVGLLLLFVYSAAVVSSQYSRFEETISPKHGKQSEQV